MDQHEPEKRIADLERQQADAAGQPRCDPARSPNRGSPERADWGQQPPLWKRLVISLVLLALPLITLGFGAYHSHAYHVGTPTTATNVHCISHARFPQSCTGTWSVGGESYTGPIMGADRDGSSLDVHVHDGTAYTADAGPNTFLKGTIFLILVSVVIVVNWARWQARRRTGG
jgi:hypothetical protein